ncbi:MAG: hypothetical protein A2W52_03925 [Candidatus Taylorbacteria bacterium RIFCSPHIGHO2_02_49_25]|uniref:Uncharacterized protein n=1 Tax=Candidatus Taylorbacteria bacterium RIFCSPHIGHO2_02_49_25 TaxID=1802305 RepID=A0A1G2MG55_9BACT|nr:MAG: hypothetical protein A2W52_03925 [Candidatus Taylorbacteria bacterium RIFCSPHIGHO2_02_49_25]
MQVVWDCCRIAFLSLFVQNNPYFCVAKTTILPFGNSPSISNRLEKTREKTCRGEPWHGVKILTGVKMPTSQAICEGNRIYSDLHLRAFCSL